MQATVLFNKRYPSRTPRPSFVKVFKPVVTCTTLPSLILPPAWVPPPFSIKTLRPDYPVFPSPTFLLTTPPVTVTATQPLASVPMTLWGVLTSALLALVWSSLPIVSSFASPSPDLVLNFDYWFFREASIFCSSCSSPFFHSKLLRRTGRLSSSSYFVYGGFFFRSVYHGAGNCVYKYETSRPRYCSFARASRAPRCGIRGA